MKSKLSSVENVINFGVWISACFYSLQKLVVAQTDIFETHSNIQYTLRDLKSGWRFLRRLKDSSDIEWTTWLYLIKVAWFYMFLQSFISEFIRRTNNISFIKYWYIISSAVFIAHYMGLKHLFIIVSQPLIFWVVLCLIGTKISIWVASLVLLAIYNSFKYKYYFWAFLDSGNDEEVFTLLYGIAWVQLRCISFCVDHIDKKEKFEQSQNKNYVKLSTSENIVNMFSYVLYLPVLFCGPLIIYEEFEKSFHVGHKDLSPRLKRFIWDMIIFAIYTILLDLAFHYIYFFAMQTNIKAIEMFPSIALCGGGLWMGLEFHLKYVISYGTTAAFSRLDNIDTPPTPRCIARIHVYSQMWRYFDVGLYRFLYMYVYIPTCNILKDYIGASKMVSKLLASLTTFIFIFMWHGTAWNVFVWSALNYIGIVLEYTGKAIGRTETYARFKEKVLRTEAMEVRFIALICAPLLGLSAISNFYLFAGTEVGNLYFGLLRSPSLFNAMLVSVSLYASCQVAIALQDVPSRTDTKKNR